jgi:hypothetical protein
MSKKDEQALVGRTIMEADFRKRLLADPEATVKAEGLEISPAFLAGMKGMDKGAAEQVGRIIGAVFGQQELSDDALGAVAGGVGVSAQAAGLKLAGGLSAGKLPGPGLPGGLPGGGLPQAPTTW